MIRQMNSTASIPISQQPREVEFMLHCLAMQENEPSGTRSGPWPTADLDWNSLLALARNHAVLPVLHEKLSQWNWDGVPTATRDAIAKDFWNNTARNLAMAAELMELIKICHNHSIPVVPFKGVALSHQLYGSIGMRVSGDLDLLVRQQDAMQLYELLVQRGYGSSLALGPNYDRALLKSIRQVPLSHERWPWTVEIHTSLLEGSSAQATTFESLSLRLESGDLGGQETLALSQEDLLLYLCAHGAKHCWVRFGWVCDIAQLIKQNPDLDWEALFARAQELHWERTLGVGLQLARDLLGAKLPDTVKNHAVVHSLAKLIIEKLFASPQERSGAMWRLWFQLRCRERIRDRMRYLWDATINPTVADWQSFSLPTSLSFLYYPFRLIRLFGKYAGRATGRLRGTASSPTASPPACREVG